MAQGMNRVSGAQSGDAVNRKSATASNIVTVRHSPNVVIKSFVVERPTVIKGMSAVEGVIDISWKIPRPAREVWVHVKDSNSWQNRYGYYWDGVVGDEEGHIVHLSDKTNHYGAGIPYLVRKVVPERLIYLESPLLPTVQQNSAWSGHNVIALDEREGQTLIAIFMEHTWQSQEEPVAQLRAVVQGAVDAAMVFWREYFIPDLESLVLKSSARAP
jgi:hypothetical protein